MDDSRRVVVPPRRSRWWVALGLLGLGACGIDKPVGGGTGGMLGVGQGGVSGDGTGGVSATGGGPGTGGGRADGSGGGATGGSPGAGGSGPTVVEPVGLQYNGSISFFRVVL